jgi:PAS domain S-box-containing protein
MQRPEHEQWKSREVARLLALVESERRYWQDIVSTMPVALAILNQSRYVVSANRAFRATYGLVKEDLRTRRIEDIFPGQAEFLHFLTGVLREAALQEPRSLRIERDGRPLRVTVLPHRDWDEDTAFCLLLAVEDLTGEGEAAFAAPPPVAAAAPDLVPVPVLVPEPPQPAIAPASPVPSLPSTVPAVIWTLDRATRRFTYLSESATRMLHVPEVAAPSDWKWLDRIAEADRESIGQHYEHILRKAAPDSVYSCEFRMAAAPLRWFRETVRVEPGALQGVLIDITERRTLESHYVQSQRVEALAAVAGRIAHDLNNPCMIIGGYGEEILESFAHADPRRNDLQQMLDATDRITDLTASLQAFSRKPVSGTVGLVDLRKELDDAVARMRQAGDDLTVEFTPLAAPLMVRADARGLHSLLFELAAVISDTSKVHVAIRARATSIRDAAFQSASFLAPGSGAVVLIENRGPVVPNPKRTALFESPFPGKDPKNHDGNLLARAFRHVESWDGSLWVSPDQRTVRLLLRGEDNDAADVSNEDAEPQTPSAVPVEEDPVIPEPEPPPPALTRRILVVDDEPGIRSLMMKILLREGYDVLEAASGPDALAAVRQQNVDLLLTDVVMPGMNGRELAEQVLILRPEVRVLYVSGFTDQTAVETGNYPPGSQLLQKPFTLGTMLKKVKEVLGE